MGDTDIAWETWGRTDPYFGVVSHRDYRKDQIADHRAVFFAGGKDVILGKIALCERVFGTLPRNDALDFGCGVGRLTLPLAEQFETVTGLDISPSMLDEARNNARLMGYLNVTFALSDDELSQAAGRFDFVNTYIVLQHIPTKRGMRIVKQLVDKVRPGGGFSIHFSVHTRGVAWRSGYWLVHHLPFLYAVNSVLKRRSVKDPAMQMNGYPIQAILVHLAGQGIRDAYVYSETHNDVLTFGIIGRKPSPPDGVE